MKLQRYDASERTFACPHACWCDKRVDRAAGKPGVDPATGERWTFEALPRCDCPEPLEDVVSPCEGGRLVLAADVDALLARIRAAVVAERSEVEYVFGNWSVPDQKDTLGRWWDAQSALDALLAEGGV